MEKLICKTSTELSHSVLDPGFDSTILREIPNTQDSIPVEKFHCKIEIAYEAGL